MLVRAPDGGDDWMQYRHDARGASMNDGEFSVADAQSLPPRWTVELGQYVYTQAMIADDLVVFTTAFSGKVVAVDARTGATRWTRSLNSQITTTCGGSAQPGFWAAPALDSAAVYVASPDGHAYALSRADGSTLWATKVADPSAAGHGEFIQSSPSLSRAYGKVFLGVASSFHCDEVAGRLVALDLATGAMQTAPLVGPGQQGATGRCGSSSSRRSTPRIRTKAATPAQASAASRARRLRTASSSPPAGARQKAIRDRWSPSIPRPAPSSGSI